MHQPAQAGDSLRDAEHDPSGSLELADWKRALEVDPPKPPPIEALDSEPLPEAEQKRQLMLLALGVKVFLICLVGGGLILGYFFKERILLFWETLLQQIARLGAWGVLVYVLLYAVSVSFFFPAELLTLCAGLVFCSKELFGKWLGVPIGAAAVQLGQMGSMTISYAIAQRFLSAWVRRRLRTVRTYHALNAAINEGGAKLVFLLRMSPAIPFTPSNYILGVTSIEYESMVIGSLGSLPLNFMFVFMGSQLASYRDLVASRSGFSPEPVDVVIWLFAIFFAAVAGVFVYRKTREKIRELEEDEEFTHHIDNDFANAKDEEDFDWVTHLRRTKTFKRSLSVQYRLLDPTSDFLVRRADSAV